MAAPPLTCKRKKEHLQRRGRVRVVVEERSRVLSPCGPRARDGAIIVMNSLTPIGYLFPFGEGSRGWWRADSEVGEGGAEFYNSLS